MSAEAAAAPKGIAISGWLFDQGDLTAKTQTFC
jgi:hypothetical protein